MKVGVLFSLTLIFATTIAAQQPAVNDASAFRAIDSYVTTKMRSSRIPGLSLAIVRGDSVVFLKAYGHADPTGRAVTPQTPFRIGSITKTITALAVLQLVDAGKINLDAPVQRYLPWFRVADRAASARITVRHLLTMTSGLPQSYETQLSTAQDDGALERAVRSLESTELVAPVGRSFSYSNANYEVLGMIVQQVSGVSYEDYVKAHVFAPLQMHNSFLSNREAEDHQLASGYQWWFGLPVATELSYNRGELPAGYIVASAEDMSHFLIAEMNDGRYANASVLSPTLMSARHLAAPEEGYGLGWEFLKINGRPMINLDGGTATFQASIFIDPAARVAVFITANVINALDTFSSPSGSTSLDGATTRAMAATVLSMATNEPLPYEGPGHETLTVFFDLVIAGLTILLVISLARLPRNLRRIARAAIVTRGDKIRHCVSMVTRNFVLPIVMLYLTLWSPAWKVLAEFQPDLACWLYIVALVLAVKGVIELWNTARVFRGMTHLRRTNVALSEPIMVGRSIP